jgi:hypothetical protein
VKEILRCAVKRRRAMMKLRWAVLFTALTVFLTACPPVDPPVELGVSLTATPTSLTAPGKVTLTATVTGGPADQVEFFNGTTSINVDTTEPYTFEIASLAATATFRAVATKGDVTANSANVQVTVGAAPVTMTLAATPTTLPTGGAPVKLDATITAGANRVSSVVFAVKGGATLNTDSATPFSFTTAAITANTTFVATARDAAGATLTTAEVAVSLAPAIPAGASKAATADAINAVAATSGDAATIAVTADITCAVDNCIQLKANQRLVGANAAGTAIAARTINVTGAADSSTVIVLATGNTVESLNISGTGIYEAIVSGATPTTGAVTIRNVAINMGASTRTAIRIGTETPTDRVNDVVLEGVTVASQANDRDGISIVSASAVTIRNTAPAVTVTFDAIAAPATNASRGISIIGVNTTIVLDGAAVTSGGVDGTPLDTTDAPQAPAFNINRLAGAGTMTLSAKNTRTVVGASGTAFHLTGVGGPITVQADSTGNTVSPATATRVFKSGAAGNNPGTGDIQFTP